jgi:diaminopimelate decarboxylase
LKTDSHHSSERTVFWRGLIAPLLGKHPSPFYLFSLEPIEAAMADLHGAFGHLPIRHWLSFKTQPLRPLIQWWNRQSRPIEVVSEFEFLAARAEGFAPERILVNGPAKHHWLPRHPAKRLCVNFDSPAEARALAPLARRLDWTCGVRFLTREEFDPEKPDFATQFGLAPEEAIGVIRMLKRSGARLETTHFHLRTNVASAAIYERALKEIAEICRAAGFSPLHIDCGGGFPPPHVRTRGGQPVNAQFDFAEMGRVYERALTLFPSAREIWLENGRWLTARSGVLVVRVLDSKQRGTVRSLICNGGRTMNALVSNWETHDLFTMPRRRGEEMVTTVNGPTCMAFDQLARLPLPRGLRVGDHVVWMDSGAYHLPWETRFSHGLATVLWHDGRRVRVVRSREDFSAWWSQWR